MSIAAIIASDGIDPATLIIALCATLCALIVLLTIVLVGLVDHDRVDLDPYAAAHGDVPGFSREQLERFQAERRGGR